MLLLKSCLSNKIHRILILVYISLQMCIVNTKSVDNSNSRRASISEGGKNKTTCDEARMQCDRLYSVLSTVEEDCKTYRIYLGCLSMLKITQSLCQADFHYWMMLSTTEKLITEKCSPGDTSPIEPPREIFNYPIAPKYSKTNKISSLSPCLDSVYSPSNTKNQYHSCALFGHPNLITFSGERQTCRLRGAWPLVNNRYLSVQVSGKQHNQFHFHDPTASVINQISIILKPDGKCLGDLAVPTLIYVASSNFRLSHLFLNNRRDMHHSLISIKSIESSEYHEKVELWFGYINTRIFISRTLVSQGEYTLSVSVLLPSQVAMAKPRSKQQSLVRELCSLGCPPPESIDDVTLLSHFYIKSKNPKFHMKSLDFCHNIGLNGVFFDVCYLMCRLLRLTNTFTPHSTLVKKSIERYISTSTKHVQSNIMEFSKQISENFSIDLSQRIQFQQFRPLWKIRQLDAEIEMSKGSCDISLHSLMIILLPLLLLTLISNL